MARLALDPETVQAVQATFPMSWPQYYLDLVGSNPLEDPIARMGRPDLAELRPDSGDILDPIADRALRPVPFVVRKHKDRVILLTTKKCHFYCRFCFRREEPHAKSGEPDISDWQNIFAFLAANPEIEEPILSGGDPLTLSDARLFWIRDKLADIPSVRRWRIHSRAPVHFPRRVTPALFNGLSHPRLPLMVVAHFNHPQEITSESARIATLATDNQIELQNQAVLLAGINDDAQTQVSLWQELSQLGVRPRYLHHPDRVAGNAHFRVSIPRGRAIYRDLCRDLNDGPPDYVLDLPNGRGKIPIMEMSAQGQGKYNYQHLDGSVSTYQDIPSEPGLG